MANVRNSNSIYVDTASDLVSSDQNVKLTHVVFSSSAAGDTIKLRDGAVDGPVKLVIKNGLANDTKTHRFDIVPIVFPTGIYVDVLSSGAVATLITTAKVS